MSVQLKMGLVLILVTTLTLSIFGVYQYRNLEIDRMARLDAFADRVTHRLSESLVLPMWDMESAKVRQIIQSEMADRNIAAITVKDYKERVFGGMQRGNDGEAAPLAEKVSGNYIRKDKAIVLDDDYLGRVVVYVTPELVQYELKTSVRRIVVTVVLLDVVLFLALSVGLGVMIILPINKLLSAAEAVSSGDFTGDVEMRQRDEIGKLANAFQKIILSMRDAANAAAEIAGGNLDVAVRERSDKDRMMQALNGMIRTLKRIMNETEDMIRAVGRGELDVRGDAGAYDGGWRDLVAGMNELIDGLRNAASAAAALRREMALARKIQTSLLPDVSGVPHPELEIAAAMIPADEVGGDFYDVLHDRSGRLWLAVGDVSGHGVTPGLIMMMAQTVFTAVTAGMDCDARDAVTRVNDVLYRNVHERLKETHFMTFTALKYLGQGRFQHAGAHLSMLVFRRKTRARELIRTRGVYLNLKKDVSGAVRNAEFRLDPGDVLVLYTDGLTEAVTPDGRMLDIDGFVNIVERHASEPPGRMKDMILTDVRKWCDDKRKDDMSIVVIKRKEM